jgi:hypothetical protein
MWHVAALLEDSSGLKSALKGDSVRIYNTKPKLSIPDSVVAWEDSLWTYAVNASDSDGDALTYGLRTVPPAALSLTPAAGNFSWKPANTDVGRYPIIIWVADVRRDTVTDTFSLVVRNVNDKPVIDSASARDSVKQDTAWAARLVVSDQDAGDSLTVQWIKPVTWAGMPAITRTAQKGQWAVNFGGVPAKSDTGWFRFEVGITDIAKTTVIFKDSVYVVRVNYAPVAKVTSRRIQWGAAQYKIDAVDDRDTMLNYVASIAETGGTSLRIDRQIKAALFGTTFAFYPLADGKYVFSCYAVDSDSLKSAVPVADTFTVANATSRVIYRPDTVWQMLSVPALSRRADDLKNNAYLAKWDESGVEDKVFKYYKTAGEILSTAAGYAYWRQGPDTVTVKLARGELVDTGVTIRLSKSKYGWNMLASPYPYPVRWPGSEVVWKWNDVKNDYEEQTEGIMYPWEGYFVLIDTSRAVKMSNEPAFTASGRAKRLKVHFAARNEWQVRLKLTAGNSVDNDNMLGFSPDAENGRDVLDRPEPPRMAGQGYCYFAHPEWKYAVHEFASDVRRNFDDFNIFQMGVSPIEGVISDKKPAMEFFGAEDLKDVYLFVATPDSLVYVRDGEPVPVKYSSTETMFTTVIASSDRDLAGKFPLKFLMRNPYPNPFRNNVNLQYVLPYKWEKNGWFSEKPYAVSINIYDVRGRLVRSLANRSQKPGTFRVIWDGKSNTGRLTAAGSYIVVMKAGDFTSNKQIMLVK